jgi:hypothetical protein
MPNKEIVQNTPAPEGQSVVTALESSNEPPGFFGSAPDHISAVPDYLTAISSMSKPARPARRRA